MTRIAAGWQCSILIGEDGRATVCGGLASEGPSIQDPTQEGQEQDKQLAPVTAPNTGAGSVMDLVSGGTALTEYELIEASVGEAHAVVASKDGKLIGWGYNRQAQAVGYFTDETVAKMERIIMADAAAAHMSAVCVAAGGSQSYALLRPGA